MNSYSRTRRLVVAAALIASVSAPGLSSAQEAGSTGPGFEFSPSISLLASFSNNPLQIGGATASANFLLARADFPFRFRGPRWSGSFAFQPAYQRYPDQPGLDNMQNAGRLDIEGVLSRRTRLYIDGDLIRSDDLRGQLGSDIVLPRSMQVRAGGGVLLSHQMTRRDTVSVSARYRHLSYPDAILVGNRSFSAAFNYSHQIDPRLAVSTTADAQAVSFGSGTRARSVSATAGFRYRLAPRTLLNVEGGALLVQQDLGAGYVNAESPGFAFRARLTHSARFTQFGLVARRDMGFTNGLGNPTIRSQLMASISTGRRRWNLLGAVGYGRNELIGNLAGVAVESIFNTWTGCVGAGVRVVRHVSVVGSFLFAHQINSNTAGDLLNIDSYRAAVGLSFQANPPAASRARNFETGSINVTC